MQTLNADLKSGTFKPVYLLYGEERFLLSSYRRKFEEAICPGDSGMNLTVFEGKGIDVNALVRTADTLPFFAERRLVVASGTGLFKSAAPDVLLEYLTRASQTTVLLFVETETDKRSRLFKKVKQVGYAAELSRQSTPQLARWTAGLLAGDGKKISPETAGYFLSLVGDDMERIRNELFKLSAYVGERADITDEDVAAVCSAQVESRIFDMVSAIVERRTQQAMDLYEDLLALREPPLRILFLIARQYNQILQIREQMEKGLDAGAIAARLKLQPFVVRRTLVQARRFSKEQLLARVEACTAAEEAVKRGNMKDRLAVELLITGAM